MIWLLIPHAEQLLNKFVSQKLSPICHENPLEKASPYFMEGHYAFAPLESHAGVGFICSLNICKELRTKAWHT